MITNNRLALVIVAVFASLYVVYANIQCMMGNPIHVVFAVLMAISAGIVLKSLYPAVLALGIMIPFDMPNPIIRSLPVYHVFLAMCVAGFTVSLGLHQRMTRVRSVGPTIIVFFLIVVARYLAAPSLPGYAVGVGQDVSGFRAWFDFFISLTTVLLLGHFINTRTQFDLFLRTLLLAAIFFTLFFLVLMPLGSYRLGSILVRLGVYITFFGNGWFRFVVLPSFGLVLLAASLLPNLFRIRARLTRPLLFLGITAVIAGGNRISLISAACLVGVILAAKRSYTRLSVMILSGAMLLACAIAALDAGIISPNTPGVRLLALLRTDVAQETDAQTTIEWRMIRWRMAVADIKRRPFFGSGFGGAKGEMLSFNPYQDAGMTQESAEVYVASGATHNGYLTAARALGIPAALLLVFILLSQFSARVRDAWHAEEGLAKDAYAFVAAFQGVFLVRMLVGMEPQFPLLWMFISLGFVVKALHRDEKKSDPGPKGPEQGLSLSDAGRKPASPEAV